MKNQLKINELWKKIIALGANPNDLILVKTLMNGKDVEI